MIRFAINVKDLELDFARIQFYKPLASKVHPAGASSPLKAAFLRILSIYNYMFSGFGQYFRIYKPWMSKLHPAGAFSSLKIAFLDFLECIDLKNQRF